MLQTEKFNFNHFDIIVLIDISIQCLFSPVDLQILANTFYNIDNVKLAWFIDTHGESRGKEEDLIADTYARTSEQAANPSDN